MTVTAQSGKRPTIEWTLSLAVTPVGTLKDIIIEAVFLIPHAVRADLVDRAGDQYKSDHEIGGQTLISSVVRG